MAAVQAAAAEAAQDSGGKKGSGLESRPPSVQKAPPPAAREREKLLERLRGACEGGSVIPVPFLPAAHAVPSALLDDLRAPYLLHPHPAQTYALLVSQLLLVDPGTTADPPPLPPPSVLATTLVSSFQTLRVRSYCVTPGWGPVYPLASTLFQKDDPRCFWPQGKVTVADTRLFKYVGVAYVWEHDVSTPRSESWLTS